MTKLLIIVLLVVLLVGFQIYKNLNVPDSVGLINGAFKPLRDTPNGVSSQATVDSKAVAPLKMTETLAQEKKQLKELILSYENTELVTEKEEYLHFVFTSEGLHFKDDVELYFQPEENIIEYKSQSRIGYSDMGVNRQRYERIKEDYKTFQ